jgi:hypothetical protein
MNIQLTSTVFLLDDRQCAVAVAIDSGKYIVTISHSPTIFSHYDTTTEIDEQLVNDVEHLAMIFSYEQVCVFQAIVTLLGKAYTLKDIL